MVTASGDQERIQAIEAGADDFMAKVYNQVELRSPVKGFSRPVAAFNVKAMRPEVTAPV